MPILGHGIDIVETARIRKMVDDHGQHFLDRVFTPAEQVYCALSQKRRYEHLAARFAASLCPSHPRPALPPQARAAPALNPVDASHQ